MRSIYKPLGNYIQQIKTRNVGGHFNELRGVSIEKYFMPSVANTHGVDLSKYKVVQTGQFAFNPMHVGRDKVLPISLLASKESVIVSPAYTVFRISDEKLLPEYLMMWCSRTEFDRNAWFKTDGNVRGGLSWEDFCEITMPVPEPQEQQRIISEYNAVTNIIMLNKRLVKKLEDTAQAIYKQWFIDFEFPMSYQYAESISKPELAGRPYRTNGGEMRYDSLLKKDIPSFWRTTTLQEYVDKTLGGDWGKAEPTGKYTDEAYCIRGTDVNRVSRGIVTGAPVRYLLPKNFQSRSLKPGQIVFEISGGSPIQSTGRACLISDDLINNLDKGIICSNFCRAISLKSEKFINFFYSHIQYLYSCGAMFRYENSTTGVKNFGLDSFLEQEAIIVPDDGTVNDFNMYFNSIRSSLYNSARQLEVISNHKAMLLSELMLGDK